MNTFAILVYLASVIDGLNVAFRGLTVLSVIGLVISSVIWGVVASAPKRDFDNDENEKQQWVDFFNTGVKRFLIATVVFVPLAILTPSSKTIYMMIGAHYGEEAVTSEKVQQMGEKGLKLLDQKMDKRLQQLSDDKQSEQ